MAKADVVAGATSQSVNIFIQNNSVTTGAGLSGLVFNTAGLTCYYSFTGANAGSAVVALATLAAVNSAYSSGGFKEIDAVTMTGWYRFDIPNAALAAAKGQIVSVHFQGAANMAMLPLEIQLTGWNNQDGVRGGLTGLANAVPGAAGGLLIAGANAATTMATFTITGAMSINGTGNVAQSGDAFGRIGVAGVGLTAVALTATQAFNNTGTWTGSLTGSVGSVTGAVGSVTAGVTVTTNNDKTGYALTQAFPPNFSSMLISGGGAVTAALDTTNANRLKDVWQIHGLDIPNPLTVSTTARAAGTIAQTIGTVAGTTSVTRTA